MKKNIFFVASIFLVIFNQTFSSQKCAQKRQRSLVFYNEDLEGCPAVPFFQIPANLKILRPILQTNEYSFEQVQFLAGKIFDANKLTMTLLMMRQNDPHNTYMPQQKTILQIVDEIQKASQEISIVCLPAWNVLQPNISDYLMKTNNLESSEIEDLQKNLKSLSGCFVKITELRQKIAEIIRSDKYYKIFLMILENSRAA